MIIRLSIIFSLLLSGNVFAQDLNDKEKAYFLRITDKKVFNLSTNSSWESFEKKNRLGGVFYKYRYKINSAADKSKKYTRVNVVQTIKVASKLLGSSGDMTAMLVGVKIGLRGLSVKKVHEGKINGANWRLYNIFSGEKPVGSIMLAQEGRVTSLYLMFGIRLDSKSGEVLVTHLVSNMKAAG